nr:hypothetical protein [Tanacetum cinerariifolium]
YVCQPPGFEYPDFPDRVYKIEKTLYGLHQALRACSTKKELCNAFERLMHKKFLMSSMGELTFFLGLQVKQKNDEIFISQDKYVAKNNQRIASDSNSTDTLLKLVVGILKHHKIYKQVSSTLARIQRCQIEALNGIHHWEDARKNFFKAELGNRSSNKVYSYKRIIFVVRVVVKKKWGYRFLTSIVVRRSNKKEYEFSYADLPRLGLNEVEDMFLLKIQISYTISSHTSTMHFSSL